jgi:hypothetical protein
MQDAGKKLKELTVKQYARRKRISIQAVYQRLWEGKLQGRQLLGRWLVRAGSTEPLESEAEIEMTT